MRYYLIAVWIFTFFNFSPIDIGRHSIEFLETQYQANFRMLIKKLKENLQMLFQWSWAYRKFDLTMNHIIHHMVGPALIM